MKLTKTGPELDTAKSTIFEPESEPNLPAGTIQSTATPTSGPVIGSSAVSCKEVLIYTEITLPYFRACSTLAGATTIQAGVQATIDRITSIFAVKAGIFFREGIVVKLHSIRVWTTQDPYSTLPATSTMLINFATAKQLEPIWNQYHVASLIDLATGTRNLGGLAYTDQLNKAAKCNVQCLYTSFLQNSYSWTVNCWTHETGHTMSSKHTHWCGWRLPNGTIGRIDSCWSGEGTCGTTSRTSRRGTVMSYCHIGGLIDFNLGFGPLPGNQIRLGLANSTVPCTTTVQPTCTSFTYSAWSACQNGTQTRTVVSASPTGCINGSPILSQPCQSICIDRLLHLTQNNQSVYRFNIAPGCIYSVSYCRYDGFGEATPPLVGSVPSACGSRLSNYTPTATELSQGFVERIANPQPSQRQRWYSVDVTSGSQRVRTFFWWP